MSTLQGIINKGIINSELQFEKMAYISTNVSNYNTNGYKGVRFEQMVSENGYLSGVARTDFRPGAIQRTDRELDIALDGYGFIPVTSKSGSVAYTREGSFGVDKDGYIITNSGDLVGDGIQLPTNYDNLRITAEGDVETYSNDGTKIEYFGTIPIVNFTNPEGLKKGDDNKYYITEESGEPVLIKNHHRIKQGNVEVTNIDMMNEVNEIMRLNASMLASFKVMKTVNDMYSQAIQLNQ